MRQAQSGGVLDVAEVRVMLDALTRYKSDKQQLDAKIIENENWFKGNYWQYIKGTRADGHEPSTPFLFNACWNKHADAMDNYPEPVLLEREAGDRAQAKLLSGILPLILEKNDFEKVYSDVWWYKLKQGTGIYAVLWDGAKENGRGDIAIKKVDLLRFYCEPGIDDLQESRYVFVLSLADTDRLRAEYRDDNIPDDAAANTAGGYFGDFSADALAGKSCLIDCYEKRSVDGRTVVHLTKIVGERALYSTRTDPALCETGLYAHGMYPFVADTLIPVENSIYGLGMVDLAKGTQAYIDKLDYIIERNSFLAGKQRWLVKNASGISRSALMDMAVDVIPCDTTVDETAVRPIQAQPVPQNIMEHRQNKISELKEVIGNRDFAQGGTLGGVTAYGAITALQESGTKLSRDVIRAGYRAFHDIVLLCIELIRQFYSDRRTFRIVGEEGKTDYVTFDNTAFGDAYSGTLFDVRIIPQKKNPFNTVTHNQLILDLLKMGAFSPAAAASAEIALDAMILDNKQAILEKLRALQEQTQTEAIQEAEK